MNSQIVTVNLVPGLCAPAVIRVSQYDVGRPLTIRVLDGTGAASFGSSVTATIVGTKPSGLGFTQSGTITSNTVTLNTTLAMTQECGVIPAEIRFTTSTPATVIGTANFILAVEPSPHPDGTTDGTYETMADLEARVAALESGQSGTGLTQEEKDLILALFAKAAYADDDAALDYDELAALWTIITRSVSYNLTHVTSSNTSASVQSGESYTTTLTADTNYTLNSVSVTMGGVDITSTAYSSGTITIPSVTGNIVITATATVTVSSISASYTQSGTIYTDDNLSTILTAGTLVVTATYPDTTTATIPNADCTLSGTLSSGTSTITVSYGGKTTTFNVTVTAPLYSIPDFEAQTVTVSGRTQTVSKANGVYTMTGTYGDVVYIYPDGTANKTKSNTLWFATPDAKPMVHEIFDITWNNPNSMTVDLACKFSQSNTTGNKATASYTMTANGSGTEASAEFSNDAYPTANFSAYGIQLWHSGTNYSNAVTVSFKMRLFCDGVRYL